MVSFVFPYAASPDRGEVVQFCTELLRPIPILQSDEQLGRLS
jgi:hypothetical protein